MLVCNTGFNRGIVLQERMTANTSGPRCGCRMVEDLGPQIYEPSSTGLLEWLGKYYGLLS